MGEHTVGAGAAVLDGLRSRLRLGSGLGLKWANSFWVFVAQSYEAELFFSGLKYLAKKQDVQEND